MREELKSTIRAEIEDVCEWPRIGRLRGAARGSVRHDRDVRRQAAPPVRPEKLKPGTDPRQAKRPSARSLTGWPEDARRRPHRMRGGARLIYGLPPERPFGRQPRVRPGFMAALGLQEPFGYDSQSRRTPTFWNEKELVHQWRLTERPALRTQHSSARAIWPPFTRCCQGLGQLLGTILLQPPLRSLWRFRSDPSGLERSRNGAASSPPETSSRNSCHRRKEA